MRLDLTDHDLTGIIVAASIDVHRPFGPGLFEKVYCGYRLDILVERRIVVEVKAVDALGPIHLAQMLTYLRLSGCRIGLILNFNVRWMKAGIRRVVWDPPLPQVEPGDAEETHGLSE